MYRFVQSARQFRAERMLDHPGAALAKADGGEAVAPAMGAEDRLVAVFEKRPGLARCKADRALAVLALLAEAAPARLGRARNRAGAEEIAGLQVAAAAGVVGDELSQRPVEVCRIALRHAMRRQSPLAHLRGQH